MASRTPVDAREGYGDLFRFASLSALRCRHSQHGGARDDRFTRSYWHECARVSYISWLASRPNGFADDVVLTRWSRVKYSRSSNHAPVLVGNMVKSVLCVRPAASANAVAPAGRIYTRSVPAQANASPIVADTFGLDHDHMITIIDVYWQARGIYDPKERARLVEIAVDPQSVLHTCSAATSLSNSTTKPVDSSVGLHASNAPPALPGVETVWSLQTPGSERFAVVAILQVSRRLVELASILGVRDGDSKSAGHLDVAQMLLREPRLLTADLQQMTRRLFELRVKMPGQLNIARLLMQQPSLLLNDFQDLKNCSAQELLPALSHGLASDNASNWDKRYQDLLEYKQDQGHTHCGFRDGDDPSLSRWCKKQRSDHSKGDLTDEQVSQLRNSGFELDSEVAEWMCWYSELQRFHRENGKTADWEPFTAQHQLYLTNWCAVQRIARRSGVMPIERVQMLDDLGFQWSGADPLS
eukprot:jgi/Ulvmu1/10325/UM061_0008.1